MNDKEVIIEIKGKTCIYTEDSMSFFIPRVTTIIPYDSTILGKLKKLGFELLEVKGKLIQVILPPHWTHFKMGRAEEYIVDILGRKRIKINKDCTKLEILKRFGYDISFIHNSSINHIDVITFLTDNGRCVEQVVIPNELLTKFISETDGNKDAFINRCVDECKSMLNQRVPNWEDELSYWENN